MKVPYASLRMHFPHTDSVGRDELYHWRGYRENINDPNFYNTCAIGERRGIVSFFIYGDAQPQGHIAIVSKDRWGKYLRCGNEIDGTATGCYWSSREVWFWPLA